MGPGSTWLPVEEGDGQELAGGEKTTAGSWWRGDTTAKTWTSKAL